MKKSLLFLLLCIVMPIQAANIYVKPASLGGNDETGDGTSWETAYATPTKAFGVASTSGDVIAVMQGTYTLTSSLINTAKTTNISVMGGYTGVDNNRVVDASNTIFEYAGTTTVRVLADYGAGLLFSGITFQNLQPDGSQYGIFVNIGVDNANLTLEDCVVKNFVNKSGFYVRGIFRFNKTATLNMNRCQFIDCEEKSTDANNAVITRNAGNATIIIKNSIIKGTKTRPFITGAAGGTNTYTIINCNFINNPGGAGVNLSTNFTTTIKNSIFYNSSLSGGGTLNNSYYNGSIGTLTANNSVLFSNASDVFSNETNFYPALTFAGIDNGDNTVFTEGDKDVVGNNRLVNSTVDIGAYENIVAPVGVAGSNVTSVGVATSSYYPYGASAQIPVTVSAGCVPDPIEGVIFTGTGTNYLATFTVNRARTITFSASQADFEVTLNTTNVTVTSPTLVDGKYSSASSSIIYFTLNEGTENPVATVNDNPATPVLINGSDYSLTLSGLTGATNVVISASVKVFDVTLSKNSYVASTTGLIEGTQQKEYGYSDLTFTLATGAHSPYVTVNGVVKATTESSGVYSLPGFAINSVSDIVISAFAANVLPVSDDTYQRRGGEISGVYATETTLNSRGEPAGWARIPLMKFVPTEAMKIAGYNKAVLRMVPTATVADLTYTVRQFPVGYASIHDVPANDYTNLMKASVVGVTDQQVAFTANQPVELNVTDSYVLNFPEEITISLVKDSNSTVHYLHSLENGNANYVPVLIFSEPNVTFSDEETVVSTNTSYGNITVAAGKKLTVNTGVTLTGAKLILKSDENGTATFVNNGTATFATADVEQYLSTTDGREWYYLASPVTTDHSNAVFGKSALVGVYKENLHKYTNPVADTALVAGAGYVVKLSTSNPTYTFSGVLNDGNISVPVSRTGTTAAKRGFNLVGNPYPSYLDWDDVDKTNVMSTIWTRTFEGSAMVFKTYNADAQVGSDDETTARIAPLQAFWVKVPADKADIEGLTLDFNNSLRWHKTNDDAPLRAPTMVSGNAVEKNVGTQQLLRLQVSNGVNNDNAVIVFDNRASDLFDAFDSEKVTNNSDQIPEIYSLADGAVNPLVINCFKGMANSREFKLGFSTLVDGSFTIAALTRKNIENLSVVLVDKLLGLQHNLATAYTFVSNAVNTTERFSVRFQSEQTTVEMSENAPVASAYCNTNRRIVIALNNNAATGIKAQIYNVAGQLLSEQHLNANITRSEQSFEPGIYFVKIKSQKIKVIVN